jgi:hypothetical protein
MNLRDAIKSHVRQTAALMRVFADVLLFSVASHQYASAPHTYGIAPAMYVCPSSQFIVSL